MSLHLSVVLPAYDEAERIGAGVERVLSHLARRPYGSELIVVSEGSRDATAEQARKAGGDAVQVIEYARNRGKGYAVRTGVAAARGAHVLFSDADLSTPIQEADRLLAMHAQGYEVVFGSRALPDSDVRVRQPWWRQSMGRTFNQVVRRTARVAMRDTQCGFKSFERTAARRIFERARIDRYAFDVELLWIATRLGCRVGELPVAWVNDPHSKVHPVRDSLRMLWDVARIRWLDQRGAYDGPA
jgi:dolichyl-phosphate beta-glucosyltransferase